MSTGTYVYCLVASARRPSLARVPAGLPGLGRPRVLDVDVRGNGTALSRYLIVADAPLNRYGEDVINRRLSDLEWVAQAAVAHEAVIESFVKAPAVLPMKLFTIFSSDERAVDHMRADARRIDAVIRRVANRLEWGVRVVLTAAAAAAARTRTPSQGGSVTSGKSFLMRKKAHRDASRELSLHARDTMEVLYERLAGKAADAKRRTSAELPVKAGPLLLDAAFLVPVSKSTHFRAAVQREARTLGRSGYHVTLTGPWPPYTFVQG